MALEFATSQKISHVLSSPCGVDLEETGVGEPFFGLDRLHAVLISLLQLRSKMLLDCSNVRH